MYCDSKLKWPLYGKDGSMAAAGTFGHVRPVSGLAAPLPMAIFDVAGSTVANA
ncbi:hypothetical protein D3C72_2337340 [compost metagenome]